MPENVPARGSARPNITPQEPTRQRKTRWEVQDFPTGSRLPAKRQFATRYGRAYPKAVEVLERDWDRMVTFYRFPREHWKHLRTTNVVESPFAAVRLRTDAAKRISNRKSSDLFAGR